MKINSPDMSNTFPIRIRCSKCGSVPNINEMSDRMWCSYKDIKKYMYFLTYMISIKMGTYSKIRLYGKSVSSAFHRTHEGKIIGKYLHAIPSIQKFTTCKCGLAYQQVWAVEYHDSLKIVPTNRRCKLRY